VWTNPAPDAFAVRGYYKSWYSEVVTAIPVSRTVLSHCRKVPAWGVSYPPTSANAFPLRGEYRNRPSAPFWATG
jgi:hypothetical protein